MALRRKPVGMLSRQVLPQSLSLSVRTNEHLFWVRDEYHRVVVSFAWYPRQRLIVPIARFRSLHRATFFPDVHRGTQQGKGKSPPGVYPGDRLFKVDGEPTESMSLEAVWSSVARATRPVMLHILGPVSAKVGYHVLFFMMFTGGAP